MLNIEVVDDVFWQKEADFRDAKAWDWSSFKTATELHLGEAGVTNPAAGRGRPWRSHCSSLQWPRYPRQLLWPRVPWCLLYWPQFCRLVARTRRPNMGTIGTYILYGDLLLFADRIQLELKTSTESFGYLDFAWLQRKTVPQWMFFVTKRFFQTSIKNQLLI